MNAFYVTIQIMAGILLPIAVCGLVYLAIGVVSYFKTLLDHHIEGARKRPPYDDIKSSISFSDNAMVIQLVKGDEVVFEDKISRRELERRHVH